MSEIEIIVTNDGSNSLLNKSLNETYHSKHGAVQESHHVFIKNGLNYFIERNDVSPVTILEVGFGTGLNALLTLQQTYGLEQVVHYTTIETDPLNEDLWDQLNYGSADDHQRSDFIKIHKAQWETDEAITSKFIIQKKRISLQEVELTASNYHIIYYDAFAPNKQPSMWTMDVLKKIVESMSDRGIFVTYCAKGQLKRDLVSLGLHVETLPGPPGKKEMIRATKGLRII
jgi:tRNA U34 5-methylaminomethyl-2-thiouridine-forming methyltransferase MnmC